MNLSSLLPHSEPIIWLKLSLTKTEWFDTVVMSLQIAVEITRPRTLAGNHAKEMMAMVENDNHRFSFWSLHFVFQNFRMGMVVFFRKPRTWSVGNFYYQMYRCHEQAIDLLQTIIDTCCKSISNWLSCSWHYTTFLLHWFLSLKSCFDKQTKKKWKINKNVETLRFFEFWVIVFWKIVYLISQNFQTTDMILKGIISRGAFFAQNFDLQHQLLFLFGRILKLTSKSSILCS